jgi:hypothetical protein
MKKVTLFLFCLFVCATAFPQDRIDVVKKENTELQEMEYGVNYPNCPMLWTVRHSSFSSRIGIKEEQVSGCTVSLEQLTRIRAALLDKVIGDIPDIQNLHSFYWGTLPHDSKNEYARRVAVLASKSPLWDKKNGKAIGKAVGDVHYFAKMINEQNSFPELASLFAAHGLSIKADDVERIFVGHLDFPANGISKADTVPVDCNILFLITKISK